MDTMNDKKEKRKYAIIFKNGSKLTFSADRIELDDRYEHLQLFNKKENGFYEIAVFNFKNIAGWCELFTG